MGAGPPWRRLGRSVMSWKQQLSGLSIYYRCTSLYVHLVDLVFIAIIFVIYQGMCSTRELDLVSGKVNYDDYYSYIDEDGNVVEEDF
eukprot:NODE_3611_length_650_cov_504.329451_g2585_i0.p4 GENE.NODE_3611_length_650_cov_504.329451_g2585_i0~~NODE_3611_length_650_cov_504.329451_g2585_i0.p4  ORF type:complete len:94 (+),score=44.82 NODE_3611_length_650_cov_504.329451_g2585_i0:23-283(+)